MYILQGQGRMRSLKCECGVYSALVERKAKLASIWCLTRAKLVGDRREKVSARETDAHDRQVKSFYSIVCVVSSTSTSM